ncbi:MAG: hypothetical protein II625_04575 [Bacilli bacterium]|nr:hypothetical protein [Bacilli bacterium]
MNTMEVLQRQKSELSWLMEVANNITIYGFGENNDNLLEMQMTDRERGTHQFQIYKLKRELEELYVTMKTAGMIKLPLLKRKAALIQKQIVELSAADELIRGRSL